MKLFLLLLPYIITGLLMTVLAIFLEKAMIFWGWARGNTAILIIMTFIFSTFFQLIKFPKPIDFNVFDLFFLSMMTIGANRFDIMGTIQKGRWWWKSKSDQ
jgi:hypothetical protein